MNGSSILTTYERERSYDHLAQNTAQNQPERVSVRFFRNAVNRELTLNG